MNYHLILTYDISSDRLRVKVHNYLKNFGLNVQKSVFEILLEPPERKRVIHHLWQLMAKAEPNDSIRIYQLCSSCERAVSYLGAGIKITNLSWVVV
jgi:CRISPR-associated protein Cas2